MHKTYFKTPRKKDKKYMEAVSRLPCYSCGTSPVQVHHKIGGVKGMGLKACDTETMPLCQPCHMKVHQDYNFIDQDLAIEETRQKLIALGYIKAVDR